MCARPRRQPPARTYIGTSGPLQNVDILCCAPVVWASAGVMATAQRLPPPTPVPAHASLMFTARNVYPDSDTCARGSEVRKCRK